MQDIEKLYVKYLNKNCTEEEIQFLMAHFQNLNEESPLISLIEEELRKSEPVQQDSPEVESILENNYLLLKRRIEAEAGLQKRLWPKLAAAASLLLFLSVGGYFLFYKTTGNRQVQNQQHDIAPGGNKAILTLADGSKITLDDARRGTVAKQSGTIVTKTSPGQLIYRSEDTNSSHSGGGKMIAEVWNTLSTPAGGQYNLTLPDGTTAMLDAASSIRFPVAFTGRERKVEVTGQVYFKVVHNKARPFRAIVKGQTIEDIGTEFNINAYDNEQAIKTTLLEGSIRLFNPHGSAVLKPGQQAVVRQGDRSIIIGSVDTEEATAWKDGLFLFHNTGMKTVMRQLERWYNVEVDMRNLPDRQFYGEIPRNVKLSQVLTMLEASGKFKFKIQGRRIMLEQ